MMTSADNIDTDESAAVPKNTQFHPSSPTMRPPIAGPATPPAPTMLIWRPSAFPRSSGGKLATIIAIEVPCVIAAPAPCTILMTIREVMLGATPAAHAATTKMAKPIR